MPDEGGMIGPLVLVVDDEPEARSTMCRMVRGLGYRVQACAGGREALKLSGSSGAAVLLSQMK